MRYLRLALWLARNWSDYQKLKNPTVQRWLLTLVLHPERQGFERLRIGDKMCCLGQLCDIVNPSGWDNDNYLWDGIRDCVFPPMGVTSIVGLRDREGSFTCPTPFGFEGNSLYELNDAGMTWPQIATFIVRNQEHVFV